jgi:hypothetical protein
MGKSKIVAFPNAVKIYSSDPNVLAEVLTVTPADAASWLKCNKNNRPVRKRHVMFLAREIMEGNWQVNGQAIVIADDDQVLDGQHRLMAVIEAGMPIETMVVYGIQPSAFKTIDTGAVRTGADALALHFPEVSPHTITSAAVATQWCFLLERHSLVRSSQLRLSNTDTIDYVQKHPSIIECSEILQSLPREARPMSLGTATALYEMFTRKSQDAANTFMRNLYTGEELKRTDPEYLLRVAFQRDQERTSKYPMNVRMHMVIKGWNWKRRGNDAASRSTITVQPSDDRKIVIY